MQVGMPAAKHAGVPMLDMPSNFFSEVALKVYAFGGHRHISPHWNKFELAIITAWSGTA